MNDISRCRARNHHSFRSRDRTDSHPKPERLARPRISPGLIPKFTAVGMVVALTAFWPGGAEAGWLDNVTNQAGQIGRDILRQRETARQEEQRRQRERQRQEEIRRRTPPAPPPRSAPPNTYARPVRSYTANQVRALQRRLADLGYQPGPVDGAYGRNTREAIRAYQADHGLVVTGLPSQTLLDYMQSTQAARAAPAVAEVAQDAASPSGASASRLPHVRLPDPPRHEGRIITGYPLTYGALASEEADLQGRPTKKSQLDLALYIDLAALKRWPKLMDDERIAFAYANRFLMGPELSTYVAGCTYGSCNSNRPYDGWAGTNEFQREASYRSFVARYLPLLTGVAPSTPIEFVLVSEVVLQPYDKSRKAFPIKTRATTLVGTVYPVSGIQTKITYEDPDSLSVPLAQAQPYLESINNPERKAYLGANTIGTLHWDARIERPILRVQLENAALYSNPALTHSIYDFPDRTNLVTASKDESAHPKQTGPSTIVGQIPVGLLFYKYAPNTFSSEDLMKSLASQIGQDQYYYRSGGSTPDYIPLFEKKEIAGRVVSFVAREKLPKYKSQLEAWASVLPSRMTFTEESQLGFLEYADGALRMKPSPYGQGPDVLVKPALMEAVTSQGIPGDTKGNILYAFPQIEGAIPAKGFPVSVAELKPIGSIHLVLDRTPLIPAIHLDPAQAEAMWQPPNCSTYPEFGELLPQNKESMARAERARQECSKRVDRYHNPSVRASFDIEVESVEKHGNKWLVRAHLLGAKVQGPHGKFLKSYAATDFAKSESNSVAKTDGETSDQVRIQSQPLVHPDLLGVRLNMSLDEGESKIRATKKVEAVYRIKPGRPTVWSGSPKDNFQPYGHGLIFVSDAGRDVTTLFYDDDRKIIGISRAFEKIGLSKETLAKALRAKYGEPSSSGHSGWVWGDTGDHGACSGGGNINAVDPELVDGEPVANVTYKATGIATHYKFDADSLAQCHVVLQVNASVESGTLKSQFRLYDHSAVADGLKQIEDRQKTRTQKVANDLQL